MSSIVTSDILSDLRLEKKYFDRKILVSKILSFSISIAGLIQIVWLIINLKKNNVKLEINIKEIFQFSRVIQ